MSEFRRLLHAGCQRWSRWRRRHQSTAPRCHAARRAAVSPPPSRLEPVAVLGTPSLTEVAWARLAPVLAAPPRRGKRRWEPRQLLDGILWLMRAGASWREIPERFAPWHTAYERYTRWRRDGTWARILATLFSHDTPD